MALSRPYLHLPSRPLLHKGPQEQIRKKEDFSISRNTVDNLNRVTRGADIVALSLNLRSRVNVRHNHSIRMLVFPSPQLLPINRRRQRTTSAKIWQQDGFLRGNYRSRLRHEMNPTENNHVRRRFSGGL